MDMPRSIIDMGWIPLLYFTVIKCRDHYLRGQAIHLLGSSSHREGIWDGRIASCVVRKVVEVEERDFYTGIGVDGDSSFDSPSQPQNSRFPILPQSYRLREVEMVLVGSPMDRILLFCRREQEGVDCRVLVSEYDVGLQRWADVID